jgi:hypothetical protein
MIIPGLKIAVVIKAAKVIEKKVANTLKGKR